ncbi:MAG: hypothetical protein HPY68_02515 [Candidatus Atribacteria bacterium]|nr:hypothetical protein [Candidatus Atribacteria bacterium]
MVDEIGEAKEKSIDQNEDGSIPMSEKGNGACVRRMVRIFEPEVTLSWDEVSYFSKVSGVVGRGIRERV